MTPILQLKGTQQDSIATSVWLYYCICKFSSKCKMSSVFTYHQVDSNTMIESAVSKQQPTLQSKARNALNDWVAVAITFLCSLLHFKYVYNHALIIIVWNKYLATNKCYNNEVRLIRYGVNGLHESVITFSGSSRLSTPNARIHVKQIDNSTPFTNMERVLWTKWENAKMRWYG